MFAKMERYKKYYESMLWHQEPWQPQSKKLFPYVLIITDKQYVLNEYPFRVFQAKNIAEFMESITAPAKPTNDIKIKGSNIKIKM